MICGFGRGHFLCESQRFLWRKAGAGVGAGKGRRPAGQVFFHVPFQTMEMKLKIVEGSPETIFAKVHRNARSDWYMKKHLPRRPPPFPSPNAPRPYATGTAGSHRPGGQSLLHQIFQSEVVFEGVGVFQGFVGDGLHGLYGEETHVGGDEDVGEGGEPCQVVILDDFV